MGRCGSTMVQTVAKVSQAHPAIRKKVNKNMGMKLWHAFCLNMLSIKLSESWGEFMQLVNLRFFISDISDYLYVIRKRGDV